MLRHQLMMCDIHQEVLFLEGLDEDGMYSRYNLESRVGDGSLRYEDAGVEVLALDVMAEFSHLLYADGRGV